MESMALSGSNDAAARALRVEVAPRAGGHVVALIGEAGVWFTLPLEAALKKVAAERAVNVVIDLSECTMLSSLAIASIIELYRAVRPRGGTVRFASPTPAVLDIIRTLRLEQLFPVHVTVADALAATPRRASA